jgi:hypothetical protein
LVKPMEFELICTDGIKTDKISEFNGYIERLVAIPSGVDPAKVTPAVKMSVTA